MRIGDLSSHRRVSERSLWAVVIGPQALVDVVAGEGDGRCDVGGAGGDHAVRHVAQPRERRRLLVQRPVLDGDAEVLLVLLALEEVGRVLQQPLQLGDLRLPLLLDRHLRVIGIPQPEGGGVGHRAEHRGHAGGLLLRSRRRLARQAGEAGRRPTPSRPSRSTSRSTPCSRSSGALPSASPHVGRRATGRRP